MTEFGSVVPNQQLTGSLTLRNGNFRKGATSTTDVNLGTTPEITAQLMDAIAELLTTSFHLPNNWEPSTDITLTIEFELVNVQLNLDQLDMTFDYVVTRPINGGGMTKTSTQVTANVQSVTGRLGIGDPYSISVTLDAADATNPIGADAVQVHVEFHLTNVAGIGAIHITGGQITYQRSE